MSELVIKETDIKKSHKTYKKTWTSLNLSSADRKWLAKQGAGYYVIKIIDVWEDKEEYRVNVEAKIMRPKAKAPTPGDKV